MYFLPDPNTYTVLPWRGTEASRTARLICDVADPDGTPFAGDPRTNLKRVLQKAADMGYTMNVGPEAEFFLFKLDADGNPTVDPARRGHLLRRRPARPRRGLPPRHRGDAPADGLRARGGPPRGRDRPARDRLPPRRRAGDGRQPGHVPDGGEGDRGPPRHARDVHGQADPRRERLGHAREPVARARGGQRLPGRVATSSRLSTECRSLHRRRARRTCRRSPPSPTRPSTRTSGSCRATRRRSTSPGRRATARRRSASRPSAGRSTRIELRTPDPTANPYLALACMLEAGLDGISRGLVAAGAGQPATSTT